VSRGIRQRRGMNFIGDSYMDWQEKGKGIFSRPAFARIAHAKVAKPRPGRGADAEREGDTFYLPLSTW
jgi:hypothetical protein